MTPTAALRKLPAVFSTTDYRRLTESTENAARVALTRLAQREMIKPTGPRAAQFYNLVADPRADQNHVLQAVRALYPSAVLVGATVLHAHGWTTQIPYVQDVAVFKRRSHKTFGGVNLVMRPRAWYVALANGTDLLRAESSPFAIDSVTPAFALADARRFGDTWLPDPDDLDIPDDAIDAEGEDPESESQRP